MAKKEPEAAAPSERGATGDAARPPSFEEALARIEQIVERLEEGELSLDESLQLFQEGIGLSRRCQTVLDEAQRKIELLVRAADGALKTEALPGLVEKDEP